MLTSPYSLCIHLKQAHTHIRSHIRSRTRTHAYTHLHTQVVRMYTDFTNRRATRSDLLTEAQDSLKKASKDYEAILCKYAETQLFFRVLLGRNGSVPSSNLAPSSYFIVISVYNTVICNTTFCVRGGRGDVYVYTHACMWERHFL